VSLFAGDRTVQISPFPLQRSSGFAAPVSAAGGNDFGSAVKDNLHHHHLKQKKDRSRPFSYALSPDLLSGAFCHCSGA